MSMISQNPAAVKAERRRPMLVNGVKYATLTIPHPRRRGPEKSYHVYPHRNPSNGRVIRGLVKLWRREDDGSVTSYKVQRHADQTVSCTCPGYDHHGHCKHVRSCEELGVV